MEKILDQEQVLAQLLDLVDRILGPDGLINQAPGMQYAVNQYDYALRAATGFCRYDPKEGKAAITLLQAATGTGKTLAYLVPLFGFAAITGKRVGVSSHTLHLQRQIFNEDSKLAAKWIGQLTGKKLSIARRVGIDNYVSPSACSDLINSMARQDSDEFADEIGFLEGLMQWVLAENDDGQRINSGILADYLFEIALPGLPPRIKQSAIQLQRGMEEEDLTQFEQDLQASKISDVLVVNHALLVLNAYRWASILDEAGSRPLSIVVVDEADQAPDVAERISNADLPLYRLRRIAENYAEKFGDKSMLAPIQALHDHVMGMHVPEVEVLGILDKSKVSSMIRDALKAARTVETRIASLIEKADTLSNEEIAVTTTLMDAVNDLASFAGAINHKENMAVISWSPVRAYPSLKVARPNSSRILSRMWNLNDWDGFADEDNPDAKQYLPPPNRSYLEAVLLTSATLDIPGRQLPRAFDEFALRVGVIRHAGKDGNPIHNVQTDLYRRYEPINFGKMSFVLADPRLGNPTMKESDDANPWRTSPEWLDYCGTMIRVAHAQGGRCLVLTLSYQDTEALAERLSDLPDLIVHKRGARLSGFIDQYTDPARPGAILLSPAAWEGVNLPGMIQQLVITRLPFSPPDNAQTIIMREYLKNKGISQEAIVNAEHNQATIQARKKLAQGIGRGIRRASDVVTVWFADPRFPISDAVAHGIDPIILSGVAHRKYASMESCIPRRFSTEYTRARLCLIDGSLYSPKTL